MIRLFPACGTGSWGDPISFHLSLGLRGGGCGAACSSALWRGGEGALLRSPGAGAELCSPGSLRRVSRPGGRCDIARCPAWQRPPASWTCWRDHSQSLERARVALGTRVPAGSPPACGARGVPALSAASSGMMEMGPFGSRFVPLRWGRQSWQRGPAALCARAIDSGSRGKRDQWGREGGGDGVRPPRPGAAPAHGVRHFPTCGW